MQPGTYRLACAVGLLLLPLRLSADPPKPTRPATMQSHPVVSIRTVYPGMTALEVQSTVGAAIERQLDGAEGIQHVLSRATTDGTYSMQIYFQRGTDHRMAATRVKQRVQRTLSALPAVVRLRGVTVQEFAPCPLLLVTLFSPDGRWNTSAISRYAEDKIRGQLSQIPGVADVTNLGPGRAIFRVRIDPDRLASYGIKIGDVRQALQQHHKRPAERKGGKAGGLTGANPPLSPQDAKNLGDIVIKTGPGSQAIRVRDVATVELGVQDRNAYADLDGHPAVGLAVYATGDAKPRAVRDAVLRKLGTLRRALPTGLRDAVGVDLVASAEDTNGGLAPSYWLVEMELPPGASPARVRAELEYVQRLIRPLAGVQHLLMLSRNPFRRWGGGACLVVQLTSAGKRTVDRAKMERDIRAALKPVPGAAWRLRPLSGFPSCQDPIGIAVRGPDAAKLRLLAARLDERIRRSKNVTDVFVDSATTPQPQLSVDVDRTKALALGVTMRDVFDPLQVFLGGLYVCDYDTASSTCQVFISSGNARDDATSLQRLSIRTDSGLRIPLGNIAKIRQVAAPAAIDRLDGQPMVEITARPVRNSQLAETRTRCRRLFEEARKALHLPGTYELTWLNETP